MGADVSVNPPTYHVNIRESKRSRSFWQRRHFRSLQQIFSAFAGGWRDAADMPALLAIKWFGNVVCTAAAAVLFGVVLHTYLAHSALQEIEFAQFRIDHLTEFLMEDQKELALAALPILPAGVAYVVFNFYLTGGMLERLRTGRSFSLGQFSSACHRYLGKLLLIAGLTGVLALLLLVLPNYALQQIVRWFTQDAAGPARFFWAKWLHWGILLILGSVVARVYDYARIALIFAPHRGTARAFLHGIAFTLCSGMASFLLWFILIGTPLFVLSLFVHLTVRFEPESMVGFWFQLGLSQVIMLIRIAGSVATLGAQMRFMRTFQR